MTIYIKSKFASAFKQFELKYGIKKLSINFLKGKERNKIHCASNTMVQNNKEYTTP